LDESTDESTDESFSPKNSTLIQKVGEEAGMMAIIFT
jgi:hypothetical protein